MDRDMMQPPRSQKDKKQAGYDDPQERIEGREGGDDSLTDASPTDSRADEKVIVNQQREDKVVNIPSQTAVNASESSGNDEEL